MIQVMIVAGNSTEGLSNFLISKGTFEIAFQYENLTDNYDIISDTIINVDKFVYLHNQGSLGIKDIKTLKNLLSSSAFFKVNEFIFIGSDNEECRRVLEFFDTAMEMLKINNYRSKLYKGAPGYLDINNILLGITKVNADNNIYNDLVIVDNSDNAKVSYSKTKDSNLVIEPYNSNRLEQFQYSIENANKLDGSISLIESEDITVKKIPNLTVPKLYIPKHNKNSKLFVCTGNNKTGKTMFTCASAYSSLLNGKSVCILDYSDNSDVCPTLVSFGVKHNKYDMRSILSGSKLNKDNISVIVPRSDLELEARLDFLQYIYSNSYSLDLDVIFLIIPMSMLDETLFITSNSLASLWITSSRVKEDVLSSVTLLMKLVKNYDVKLILNDTVVIDNRVMAPEEIKRLIPKDIGLVKPISINSILDIGKGICQSLILPKIGDTNG